MRVAAVGASLCSDVGEGLGKCLNGCEGDGGEDNECESPGMGECENKAVMPCCSNPNPEASDDAVHMSSVSL